MKTKLKIFLAAAFFLSIATGCSDSTVTGTTGTGEALTSDPSQASAIAVDFGSGKDGPDLIIDPLQDTAIVVKFDAGKEVADLTTDPLQDTALAVEFDAGKKDPDLSIDPMPDTLKDTSKVSQSGSGKKNPELTTDPMPDTTKRTESDTGKKDPDASALPSAGCTGVGCDEVQDRSAEVVGGWDSSKPMGGMFYGNPAAFGKAPGNTPQKTRHFMPFRAPTSGKVVEAFFEVRIGKGYSSGMGGVNKYVIYGDDGSGKGYPDVTKIFGESTTTFVGGDVNKSKGYFQELKISGGSELVAGRTYYLGVINIDPDSGRIPTNGSSIPMVQADRYTTKGDLAMGPWYDIGWGLSDNGSDGEPVTDPDTSRDILPFFGVTMDDGTSVNTAFSNADYPTEVPYDWSRSDPATTSREMAWINGRRAAMQSFTVSDGDRQIDGLWAHSGHHLSGGTPNGSPLQAELQDSGGKVLARATFGSQPDIWALTNDDSLWTNKFAGKWQYSDLKVVDGGDNFTLVNGQSYRVVFTAPAGANFTMLATPTKRLHPGEDGLAQRNRDFFTDAGTAMMSTDGGKTFPRAVDHGERSWESKLGMLFTIEGQAKHMKDFKSP